MHLYLKFYSETIALKHDPTTNPTILNLKNTIELKLSLPIELQSLTFIDDIDLPNHKLLSNYGIENHSKLNLKIVSETDYKDIFLAARFGKIYELKELGILENAERDGEELYEILDGISKKKESGEQVHLEEFSPYKLHKLPLERALSVKSKWESKNEEASPRPSQTRLATAKTVKSNCSVRFSQDLPKRQCHLPESLKSNSGFRRPKNQMFTKIQPGCLARRALLSIQREQEIKASKIENQRITETELRESQVSLPKTYISDEILNTLPLSTTTINSNLTSSSMTELPESKNSSAASSRLPSALFSADAGELRVRHINVLENASAAEDEQQSEHPTTTRLPSAMTEKTFHSVDNSTLRPSKTSLQSSIPELPESQVGRPETSETIKMLLPELNENIKDQNKRSTNKNNNPAALKNIKKYENYRIFISILGAISNDNVKVLQQIYNEHQQVFLCVKSQISKRNALHFCCCHKYSEKNSGEKDENKSDNSLVTSLYKLYEIRKILHDKDYNDLTPARLAKKSGRTDNAQILLKFDWELRTNSIAFGKSS